MAQFCRQCLWYATAGGAIWLLARSAVGQGPELTYHAPENCPSVREFRMRVAQTLGSPLDVFTRFGPFQVTIETFSEGYRATITSNLLGEEASRTFTGPACDSVADAGALSIAMALSNAMQHREVEESSPEPSKSAAAPARAPSVVASASAEGTERPVPKPRHSAPEPAEHARTALALHSVADYGTLPRVAPGVRLSFGISGQYWSGRLGLEALLPVTQWEGGTAGPVGGRFWLAVGRMEGCVRLAGSVETRLDGCAVLEAGTLRASGVGLDTSKRRGLPWLATGGRLGGAVPLGNTRAEGLLGVEALVPLLTTDFTVEDGRTKLYGPTSIVGQVDLGVGWRFE